MTVSGVIGPPSNRTYTSHMSQTEPESRLSTTFSTTARSVSVRRITMFVALASEPASTPTVPISWITQTASSFAQYPFTALSSVIHEAKVEDLVLLAFAFRRILRIAV